MFASPLDFDRAWEDATRRTSHPRRSGEPSSGPFENWPLGAACSRSARRPKRTPAVC